MKLGATAIALIVVLQLAFGTSSFAQTTYGGLEGVVRDSTGAVMPSVQLHLQNEATNITQDTVTDDQGRYRLVNVLPGSYTLTAEHSGFKTLRRTGIPIRASERSTVDITLEVGGRTETVNVAAETGEIQTTTSHLSTTITAPTITELPLAGRDFSQLALLSPGVNTQAEGGSGNFVANGQRSTTNTFTVDGTDVNNAYWNNLIGGALGTGTAFASVDGIAEFRVMTSTFSAEYGRTSGAIVTAVTKSGTNDIHGRAFEFLRNDVLNANDWFANQANAAKPPLRFNNFGASAGGPIKKNKAFFFFLYEGQRERRSGFYHATVPAESVKTLADPVLAPLIQFLPTPTGPEILDSNGNPTGLAPLDQQTVNNKNENDYQARVDVQLSSRDTVFFRGTLSKGQTFSIDNFITPLLASVDDFTIMSGTLVETHMFSPRVVNEFRFGTNRQSTPFGSENATSNDLLPRDSLGRPAVPRASISGTSVYYYGPLGPVIQVQNVFQFTDNLTIVHGRHLIKAGADIRRTQINQANNQSYYGSYSFRNVQAFINNDPTYFLAVRGHVATYPRLANYSFYVQDDVKVRPNLTLNLGLRYELNPVVSEARGQIANLVPYGDWANAVSTVGARYNGDHNNFAPRIGFAWDIGGHQTQVVRGGFGVFYDVGPGYWGPLDLITNPPATYIPYISGAEAKFPVDESLLDPSVGLRASAKAVPPTNRNSYSLSYNLTYEHRLPRNIVLTASYAASQGIKLYRLRPVNLNVPGTTTKINPIYNSITASEDAARSSYNAFQMRVARPFSNGLTLNASYTWAHMIDDSCGYAFYSGSPCVASNPNDLRADRASSASDIRHNFTFDYVWDMPLNRWFGGPSKLTGGWELSGIFSARTGLPYTILIGYDNAGIGTSGSLSPQRPNIVPGVATHLGPRIGPNYNLNIAAYQIPLAGTFGDLARNTERAAGFWNDDFAIFKNTRFGSAERFNLQFRAEIFNLFNHPNFGVPAYTNTLTTDPSQFGVTDTVAKRAREIQFGLKFYF